MLPMPDIIPYTCFAAIIALGVVDIATTVRRQRARGEISTWLVSTTVFIATIVFCMSVYTSARMRTMFHVFFVVGLIIWPAIGLLRLNATGRALATLLPRMTIYLYAALTIEN